LVCEARPLLVEKVSVVDAACIGSQVESVKGESASIENVLVVVCPCATVR
jgi:hypothetical protein